MTLVVRRRRPFVLIGATLLAAVTAGGASWWVLGGEGRRMGQELDEIRAERDALREARLALEARNGELSRRIAILERARQVEAEAYARVDGQLEDLQDQLLGMKEEVAFYKGIVSDDRADSGVQIQRFVVEPEGAEHEFRFRLVLTRGIGSDNLAKGTVSLAVDGDREGVRVRLDLAELTPFPTGPLEYNFKHFQRLEGRLRLPASFVPKRVIVRLDPERPGAKPLRGSYRWPSMES